MKSKNKRLGQKGQAATELIMQFLTTYGWAFVIAVGAITALIHFGGFNLDNYMPEGCSITGDIKCIDFSVNGQAISVLMQNSADFDMDEFSVSLLGDVNSISCAPDGAIISSGSSKVFNCQMDAVLPNGKIKMLVQAHYKNRNTGLVHNKKGDLIIKISLSFFFHEM